MTPVRDTTPIPDTEAELAREIARRRSARRRAPMALAAAAIAVGAVAAAGTDAIAATPDISYAATSGGGHFGHARPTAPASSAEAPDDLTGAGQGLIGNRDVRADNARRRDAQGGNGQPDDAQGGNDQPDNAQGGNDQPGNGRGRDEQARNGQGQNNQGQNNQGQNNQGQNNQGQNNQGQNNQGRNNQGQNDQNDNGRNSNTNGLDVLARDCGDSRLSEHTGFQVAPACVDTAFGEVADAEKGPSLLITEAPTEARVGDSFTLKVSTRNLVRDRFLGAAAGGYYLESSVLTSGGLQRGHFHTACRMLESTREAPESGASPAFFVATQDNGGGADPDTVTINVTGLPSRGTAQCTSWAGDGSHRIPMMQRADQTPAIDSVRITVK